MVCVNVGEAVSVCDECFICVSLPLGVQITETATPPHRSRQQASDSQNTIDPHRTEQTKGSNLQGRKAKDHRQAPHSKGHQHQMIRDRTRDPGPANTRETKAAADLCPCREDEDPPETKTLRHPRCNYTHSRSGLRVHTLIITHTHSQHTHTHASTPQAEQDPERL